MQRLSKMSVLDNTIVGGVTQFASNKLLIEVDNKKYLRNGYFVNSSAFPKFPLMNLKVENSNWDMFDMFQGDTLGLNIIARPAINGGVIMFVDSSKDPSPNAPRDTLYVTRSLDYGESWETIPVKLPNGYTYSTFFGSRIIYNKGRFLFKFNCKYNNSNHLMVLYSDNNGKTWSKGYSGPDDYSFILGSPEESLKLFNGRLISFYRGSTSDARLFISYSDDNGITFTTIDVPVPISGSTSLLYLRSNSSYFNGKYHLATNHGYVSSGETLDSWSPTNVFPAEIKDLIEFHTIHKFKNEIISLSIDKNKIVRIYSSTNESTWTLRYERFTDWGPLKDRINHDINKGFFNSRLRFLDDKDRLIVHAGNDIFLESKDGKKYTPINLFDGVYKFGEKLSSDDRYNVPTLYQIVDGNIYFCLIGEYTFNNTIKSGYRLLFRKPLDEYKPFRLNIGTNDDKIGIPKTEKNLYLRIV